MKRHALFFATALAVASLGTAGLAAAGAVPAAAEAAASDAASDAPRAARGGHPLHHGTRHSRHRGGHAMRGGIERMDADGDGRVSRAEFDAARAAREEARAARIAARGQDDAKGATRRDRAGDRSVRPVRGDVDRGPRAAFDFDAIDANRDGYIVRSEAMAHSGRVRAQLRARRTERFAAAFAAADLNGDGRLSRVEVEEAMPRLSGRFAWMDDNRDGFLGRAELEAGKRRHD